MSDVGLGAVLATVVFGGLLFLLNAFNRSEHRRLARKWAVDQLRKAFGDVRKDGKGWVVSIGGHPIHVVMQYDRTNPAGLGEVAATSDVLHGRLSPFVITSRHEERLAREGIASPTISRALHLFDGCIESRGRTAEARSARPHHISVVVELAHQVSTAGERALAGVARAAGVPAGSAILLDALGQDVRVQVDEGWWLSTDAAPLDGVRSGALAEVLRALADHARAAELRELCDGLDGVVEVEPRPSLRLPLRTPAADVVRAASALVRLCEDTTSRRGAFR